MTLRIPPHSISRFPGNVGIEWGVEPENPLPIGIGGGNSWTTGDSIQEFPRNTEI